MKKIIFISVFLIPILVQAQDQINWITIEEAQELVKTEPRKVFTFVYADWCDHCEKMQETTLKDHEVIRYINDHFYAVKFNAETSEPVKFKGRTFTNPEPGKHKSWNRLAVLLAAYDGAIGFPTLVFFDQNFNRLVKPTRGYKSVEKINSYLKYIGENNYQTVSFEEFIESTELHTDEDVCN